MIEDGLFQALPHGNGVRLHNWPGMEAGNFGVADGPVMAGADRFRITIKGRGGHAAMPHQAADVVVAGSALVQALQTLVSRTLDPLQALVLSVTIFQAGHADNVLPERATLGGTVRTLRPEVKEQAIAGMERVCQGVAAAYGVSIKLDYEHGYPPTINAAAAAQFCRAERQAAVVGAERVASDLQPSMGGGGLLLPVAGSSRLFMSGSAMALGKAAACCTAPITISTTRSSSRESAIGSI